MSRQLQTKDEGADALPDFRKLSWSEGLARRAASITHTIGVEEELPAGQVYLAASDRFNTVTSEQLRESKAIATEVYDQGRTLAAKLVVGGVAEHRLRQYTSHGLSLVALGVDWRAGDNVGLLLAARDPETGKGFSPDEVRDQAATMILAGHETTALALSWALYLLALAPESQERVAGEVGTASRSGESDPALVIG